MNWLLFGLVLVFASLVIMLGILWDNDDSDFDH